ADEACERGHSGHPDDFDAPAGPSNCQPCVGSCSANIIYLNRNGGAYRPGSLDDSRTNTSSIVVPRTEIPAFERGDAAWQTLLGCVKQAYGRFNVQVTDVDPGSVPHVEAVIGGSPRNIGFPTEIEGIAVLN